MRISLIPAGDINTASSRIRVFSLLKELQKKQINAEIGFDSNADIIFVQKRLTDGLFENIKEYKSKKGLIIYDIDDSGPALDYWASDILVNEMFKIADFVTTDTQSRLEFIKSENKNINIELLPDCIDYFPQRPLPLNNINDNRLRVLWFGSFSNIDLFVPYIKSLCDIPNSDLVVITGSNVISEINRDYPKIVALPWKEKNFTNSLRSCHLTCLMHDSSSINSMKSNNKMISSLTWGVPAIVSKTIEYERTAKEAHIEHCLFSSDKEMVKAIESLRPVEKRIEYLNLSQKIIWEKYSPKAIVELFITLLKKYEVS